MLSKFMIQEWLGDKLTSYGCIRSSAQQHGDTENNVAIHLHPPFAGASVSPHHLDSPQDAWHPCR